MSRFLTEKNLEGEGAPKAHRLLAALKTRYSLLSTVIEKLRKLTDRKGVALSVRTHVIERNMFHNKVN